jgi:hypothetical protein
MSNANSVDVLRGAGSPAQGKKAIPAFLPGSTTSALIVTDQTGGAATANTVNSSVLSQTAATAGGTNMDGFAFKVRLVGRVTTTGTTNITVAIQQGNTTTPTAGNIIATSAATAVNTASANFNVEATCLWDSTTTKLNGYQIGAFNNTLIAAAALTNQVTVTSQTALQFVPSVTSSGASTATFFISEFVIDEV